MNDKPKASLSYHDDGATGGSIDVLAGVRAVHVDAPARSAIVMIRKRCFGLVIHRDKPEVGGETRRLGSDSAAAGDLLCPWRRWWRLAGAGARRDDGTCCCHELVREVGPDQPARLRVVRVRVAAIHHRADLMVIREGDVGAVLWVEGDLEEVGKAAVGIATEPARRDRAAMDDVVADLRLGEGLRSA